MAKRNMLSSDDFYQSEVRRFRSMYPSMPDDTLKVWAKDRQNRRDRSQRTHKAERAAAFEMLGCVCARCGEDDEQVIEIDHIVPVLGRRRLRTSAREVITAKGMGFQLLCTPCHKDKTRDDIRLIRGIM